MPKRKKYDSENLVKAFEDGKTIKDIMGEFGFSSPNQTKTAYLSALQATGKIPKIMMKQKKTTAPAKEISINKRGSLTIPKALIETLGFQEGNAFSIRKTKAGISLKLISAE